jgi:hypothetical protein
LTLDAAATHAKPTHRTVGVDRALHRFSASGTTRTTRTARSCGTARTTRTVRASRAARGGVTASGKRIGGSAGAPSVRSTGTDVVVTAATKAYQRTGGQQAYEPSQVHRDLLAK